MSLDVNWHKPGGLSSMRRRYGIKSPALYFIAATVTTILAASSIVWLERYSDREALVEISLSRIQTGAYHLGLIEEKAIASNEVTSLLKSERDAVDDKIGEEIRNIRSYGAAGVASDIQNTYSVYADSVDVELSWISKGRLVDIQRVSRPTAESQLDVLNRHIQRLSHQSDTAADWANFVAICGSVCAVAFAAGLTAFLFRHYERSQRSAAELAARQAILQQSERRLNAIVRNGSDFIVIVSPNASIGFVVSTAERVWAHMPEKLLNVSLLSLVVAEDVAPAQDLLNQVCGSEGSVVHGELQMRHGDGSYRLAEVVLTNLCAEPGIEGIVVSCRDISERRAAEAKIAHQAFHDSLTDLPNRALFMERLDNAIARSWRAQDCIAVIFMDLDNFKLVNDSLGHKAGDTLLKAVASRLRGLVRAGDTVARLGGDEFIVLLDGVDSDDIIMAITERIVAVLHLPVLIENREIFANGSIGIAVSHGDYNIADDLVRDADTAMYQAKASSKGHWVVFNTSMKERAVERLNLETDLHKALERDELRVYYQPIVSIDTGEIVELEALVRWQHPTRGLIAPSAFISIAEEAGMIVPLGAWVLETACRQIMEWQFRPSTRQTLTISVNLSVRQLHEPDLVSSIMQILNRVAMDPGQLKLEVTESIMSLDQSNMAVKLEELRAIGIRIAVDDFGTGYSSMSYLRGLPIDTLKIDRSFVSRLGQSDEDEAIMTAIVTLAKALNLRTTAEGIETVQQLDRLRALGCDLGQGYLYSRPICATDMQTLLLTGMALSSQIH